MAAKKVDPHERLEKTRIKALMNTRQVIQIEESEAWKFMNGEYKKYTGSATSINLESIVWSVNKYAKMQCSRQFYNFVNGKRTVDIYTGLPDMKGDYWINMTLAAYRSPAVDGCLHEENYYPVPTRIINDVGIVPFPAQQESFMEEFWKTHPVARRKAPGEKNEASLIKLISTFSSHSIEVFFNDIQVFKPDYRQKYELQIHDLPLFQGVVEDFGAIPVLSNIVDTFKRFKDALKKEQYWILEVAAIAFYYSLATYDEHSFLESATGYTFTTPNEDTGKNNKIEHAVDKFIDEIGTTILSFIGIDIFNEPKKMDDFYQKFFTHPAKSLSDY